MTLQTRTQNSEPPVAVTDETWQAIFFGDGPEEDLAGRETNSLDVWTADQLVAEVLERSADDAASLRLMHRRMLQALVTALDKETAPAAPTHR